MKGLTIFYWECPSCGNETWNRGLKNIPPMPMKCTFCKYKGEFISKGEEEI